MEIPSSYKERKGSDGKRVSLWHPLLTLTRPTDHLLPGKEVDLMIGKNVVGKACLLGSFENELKFSRFLHGFIFSEVENTGEQLAVVKILFLENDMLAVPFLCVSLEIEVSQ